MPVIKRYPNRKLYDTEAKQYVTLDGIATLIRQRQEVQVVDYATGEDLTAVTLTQIIFEQEKKRSGFLPQTLLTSLVQAGGDTMSSLRRTLASSLDLARHVDEEIEQRLQSLISRGELAAEEGRRLRAKLLVPSPQSAEMPKTMGEYLEPARLEQALEEHGVPSHDDLQRIQDQLDILARKLDEIASTPEAS
jgi:polyhydroxyalkanoate synthesis repressor PhaR